MTEQRTRLLSLAVTLHDMGFHDERVERLLKHTCISTVEEALYYLTQNEWQAWEHPFVPQSVGAPREKNCYFCKKKTMRNVKFMPDLLPLNWEITRSVNKESFTIIQYGRGVLINNEALQNIQRKYTTGATDNYEITAPNEDITHFGRKAVSSTEPDMRGATSGASSRFIR